MVVVVNIIITITINFINFQLCSVHWNLQKQLDLKKYHIRFETSQKKNDHFEHFQQTLSFVDKKYHDSRVTFYYLLLCFSIIFQAI